MEPELISYNFIEAIPKVYDEIFSFLNVKSLLNASLVCKTWQAHIESSLKFMRKTKVKVCLQNIKDARDTAEIFRHSKRKICHLEISYKNIFQTRIVEFWDPEKRVLTCPLILHFQLNSHLMKDLISLNITTAELKEITNILKACKNLKDLQLNTMKWTEVNWVEISSEANLFKLKTLVISSDSVNCYGHQGLHNFLKTQAECLESFTTIRGFLSDDDLKAVMRMKKLKYWEVNDTSCEIDGIEESENLLSLQELKSLDNMDELISNSALLKSIPNLQKLSLGRLDQDKIYKLEPHLKNLKELHLNQIDFDDITSLDLFPALQLVKIKTFVDFSLQETILLQIANGPTNFAQCLYDEICKPPHINWN